MAQATAPILDSTNSGGLPQCPLSGQADIGQRCPNSSAAARLRAEPTSRYAPTDRANPALSLRVSGSARNGLPFLVVRQQSEISNSVGFGVLRDAPRRNA
jgi:hypothetical protein